MKKKLTHKQQINAELASRRFNQKSKEVIKASNPEQEVADLIIEFVCECSIEGCEERVPLTIQGYESLHTNQARFVLANGHEQAPADKVKVKTNSFTIVEKPALSLAADQ